MATRTIYNQQVLAVGPTPATGGHYLNSLGARTTTIPATGTGLLYEILRVQNVNIDANVGSLLNVTQFGELAPIDLVSVTSPTVSLGYSYLVSNFINERNIGLTLSNGSLVGCLSGILSKNEDEKNYFVWVRPQGYDVHGNATAIANGNEFVKSVGNAYLTNYQFQAQVGQFPTVTIGVEGLNHVINSSNANGTISGNLPALTISGTQVLNSTYTVVPATITTANSSYSMIGSNTTNISGFGTNSNLASISVLRPGDVKVTFGYPDVGPLVSDLNIQSVNLQIPLQRQTIEELGQRISVIKEPNFPIQATLSIDSSIGDMQTGSFYDIVTSCTGKRYDARIDIISPCGQSGVASYIIKGMALQNITDNTQIGQNETSTFNFVIPIGSATATTTNVFLSGISWNKPV